MQLYKVWRRGFQFTILSIPAAAVLVIQDVMPLCPVARHPIDHTTTRVLRYMCFVPRQHPLQTSVKYRAVFLYVSTYAYSASTGYLRLCLHMASNKPLHQIPPWQLNQNWILDLVITLLNMLYMHRLSI